MINLVKTYSKKKSFLTEKNELKISAEDNSDYIYMDMINSFQLTQYKPKIIDIGQNYLLDLISKILQNASKAHAIV